MNPYTYKRRAGLASKRKQIDVFSVESGLAFMSEVFTTPVHAVMALAFLTLGAVSLCAVVAISYPEISSGGIGPVAMSQSIANPPQVLGVSTEVVAPKMEQIDSMPTYAVMDDSSGKNSVVGYCTFITPGEYTVHVSPPPYSPIEQSP